MALSQTLHAQSPTLTVITANNLDVSAEMLPWIDLYRRYCLPILCKTLVEIRARSRPPCLFVHGPSASGKTLLARTMVYESPGVACLDCAASAYQCQANLDLTSLNVKRLGVFVIDEIDYLNGTELVAFYRRCTEQGVVLALMSQNLAAPHCIGFALPAKAARFRLGGEVDSGVAQSCLQPINDGELC